MAFDALWHLSLARLGSASRPRAFTSAEREAWDLFADGDRHSLEGVMTRLHADPRTALRLLDGLVARGLLQPVGSTGHWWKPVPGYDFAAEGMADATRRVSHGAAEDQRAA